MRRAGDAPCQDDPRSTCAGFGFVELTDGAAQPWGLPLSIPDPCRRGVVGLVGAAGRSHYAVCALQEGRPASTLFSISFEPEYARADPMLTGCEPRGLATLGDTVLFAAECQGGARLAVLGNVMQEPRQVELGQAALRCEGDALIAGSGETGGALPVDHMERAEVLLPAAIAHASARAVTSAGALFVGETRSGKLRVSRYRCRAGRLSSG